MWKNLVAMLIVTALSAGVCAFALIRMDQVTDEMEEMRMMVMDLAEAGDIEGAKAGLGQMAGAWSRHEQVMEMLAPHEQLHEITVLIIEGDANLTAGDRDDFNRSMALLGEAVNHLREEEQLKLTNIL